MAKLMLRIAVIAVLVLCGAALGLGIILFQQRETLKGRTQKLENVIKRIAGTIETGDESGSMITIPDDQLKTFKQIPGGPPPMDVPLKQLAVAAQYQLDRLNTTRTDLANTKETLAQTEETLRVTTADLNTTKAKVVELTGTIEEKNTVINEKTVAIENLEREKSELNEKVASLESNVEELEVAKRDLTDELTETKEKVERLEAELDPDLAKQKLTKGQQGVILSVNPEWNFVVFDISAAEKEKHINPNLELLISRNDKLVGKVRVASIDQNMAVAEILDDWQQLPIHEGDNVIY